MAISSKSFRTVLPYCATDFCRIGRFLEKDIHCKEYAEESSFNSMTIDLSGQACADFLG